MQRLGAGAAAEGDDFTNWSFIRRSNTVPVWGRWQLTAHSLTLLMYLQSVRGTQNIQGNATALCIVEQTKKRASLAQQRVMGMSLDLDAFLVKNKVLNRMTALDEKLMDRQIYSTAS